MKNLYYLIWADAIQRFKKHNPNKKNWDITLFFFISWIHGLNLFIILLWLQYFEILTIPFPEVNIFPGDLIDKFVSFSIVFALPFLIINFLLIFRKRKFERIIEKYYKESGNYAFPYTVIIALGAFFSAITYSIIK